MNCPYCNRAMENGTLIANNTRVKFLPEDKSLLLGIWANDSIPIGKKPLLGRATVSDTWHCAQCEKYIVDVPKDA